MDASQDLVSVVVPTYNGARHLAATLRSLKRQTYATIEVIVVDDGSSDETVAVAEQSGIPSVVLRQSNLGVAVARNHGLARARGRWVGFIDQDDLWREDRVSNLVDYASGQGVRAVASTERPFALVSDRAALIDMGDGRHSWPEEWIDPGDEDRLTGSPTVEPDRGQIELITVERLMEGAAMLTTSVLYDRETALTAGGFAPHARALDDHILNLNVARISGPIHRIASQDLLYRVHPASTTTVSPMSGPFLSAMASVRLGGIFPAQHRVGSNVEHLLWGLAGSSLTTVDQLSLLLLTVPRGSRLRWIARWVKRRLVSRARR